MREKYNEEDLNGFINRQLVETRQITKHVANILKNLHKDTNIIYLKADLSHTLVVFRFEETSIKLHMKPLSNRKISCKSTNPS